MVPVFSSGRNSFLVLGMTAALVPNSYKLRGLSNHILRFALGRIDERQWCAEGLNVTKGVPLRNLKLDTAITFFSFQLRPRYCYGLRVNEESFQMISLSERYL